MTRRERQRGTSLIEFTIVIPLLVLILFGVIEFGIAFQRWQIVTNAAREGARAAAVRTGLCNPAIVDATVDGYVAVAGFGPGDVVVTHSDPCVAAGGFVTVEVSHLFDFPVLAELVPGLGDGIPLRGRAIMRKE